MLMFLPRNSRPVGGGAVDVEHPRCGDAGHLLDAASNLNGLTPGQVAVGLPLLVPLRRVTELLGELLLCDVTGQRPADLAESVPERPRWGITVNGVD